MSKGWLPNYLRCNEITAICHDIQIKPDFHQITGETFARFWDGHYKYVSVEPTGKVILTAIQCPSNLQKCEREKQRVYIQRVDGV